MNIVKKSLAALTLFPALYSAENNLLKSSQGSSEDLQEIIRDLEEQKNHNFEAAKFGAVFAGVVITSSLLASYLPDPCGPISERERAYINYEMWGMCGVVGGSVFTSILNGFHLKRLQEKVTLKLQQKQESEKKD